MPIRHSGNERKEIGNWDQWVEQELVEAHERGDFDDLPAGKAFDLSTNALDPSLEFAYSRLKNAGMKPAWMDLDGECHDLRADLDDFLERSSVYLQQQIDAVLSPDETAPVARIAEHPSGFWARAIAWLRMPETGADRVSDDSPRDRLDLIRLRQQMKDQYLERAATLDKRIVAFNNTLSREMMHLERVRIVPERANRLFEARCPQIPLPEHPDA
ncbi:MAG: DnaJ family domain-containing protein [Thermomicrobiales bacterium]